MYENWIWEFGAVLSWFFLSFVSLFVTIDACIAKRAHWSMIGGACTAMTFSLFAAYAFKFIWG